MASSASSSLGDAAASGHSAETDPSGVRAYIDILAEREGKGCEHESHEHPTEPRAGRVGAGSAKGPVRVVVDGELTPEMIHRALTEEDGPGAVPMTTASSSERVEAVEASSPEAAAARLAKRFFVLHEQRVAAFRSVDAAGATLMSAAADATNTARVMAAIASYQDRVAEATARLARATEGVKAVGAEAGALSPCSEAAAVVAAVAECQALERERLGLTAERQGLQLAAVTGRPVWRRAEGEDEDEAVDPRGLLEDVEARLMPLSARVQAAMDALREEVADAMLSAPDV